MLQRKTAFAQLLLLVKDGALPHGSFVRVARNELMAPKRVERLWKPVVEKMRQHIAAQGDQFPDFDGNVAKLPLHRFPNEIFGGNKKGVVGRKLRGYAKALGISHQTVHRLLKKEKIFRSASSALKPSLTDTNKWERYEWALSWIEALQLQVSITRTHGTSWRRVRSISSTKGCVTLFTLTRNGFTFAVMGGVIFLLKTSQPHTGPHSTSPISRR